jgi:hypothetical protein
MQQSGELALDADEVEAREMAGLELSTSTSTSLSGAEIVPKDGAQ